MELKVEIVYLLQKHLENNTSESIIHDSSDKIKKNINSDKVSQVKREINMRKAFKYSF